MPRPGETDRPSELSEVTLQDVDLVEVWRTVLVLRATPFVGQLRLRDDQYLPRIDMVGISDCAAIAPV
jgi:hypothetical protein